jgi:hypothetical protein
MIYLSYIVPGGAAGAPDKSHYRPGFDRYIETLRKFEPSKAGFSYRPLFVNCFGGLNDEMQAMLPPDSLVVPYDGLGRDMGGHQAAAEIINSLPKEGGDYLVAFSSWAYFKRDGWLDPYAMAFYRHPSAIVGSMASLERRRHLRGTGWSACTEMIVEYPIRSNSREDSLEIEAGENNMTEWFIQKNYGACLVTWSGEYGPELFRQPENIFRRGDQSNLLNFDRHTDVFDSADANERIRLARLADTGVDSNVTPV